MLYGLHDSSIYDGYFGRREIVTPIEEITRDNVEAVIRDALTVHLFNAQQIDYLYRYMRGEQPILGRTKTIRPEINNKIVENHASEICQFTSGYFLGEPVTYVKRGDRSASSKEIERLNTYMYFEDKASHDKDLATWMAVCGVGYRMVMPDRSLYPADDEAPFEIDTPDPRDTFVIYHNGFGHRRLAGVRIVYRSRSENDANDLRMVCCGYTEHNYFEITDGHLTKWTKHVLGDIPIFEYRLNMARMGSFEPAIPLLDAINTVASNRIDGVEQFVQSIMKFINCNIDDDDIAKIPQMGAVMLRSADGMNADVQIMSQELNQTQTQTLVDYLYDQVLTICGLPTTKKGGTSTSDTGSAVLLRDGWQQCEARAKDTELLFKRTEKQFLKFVLRIINTVGEIKLSLSEVECKFTRRQHDNLQTKVQSLQGMLQAGIAPAPAIATCGLFNDPMDIVAQSAEYLEKWKPERETEEAPSVNTPIAESDAEDNESAERPEKADDAE